MSIWFRTWREHSDDPQNSMLSEIYKLILQTRSEVTNSDTTSSDLEKKRVDIIPSESYVIIITGQCFVKGEARPVNSEFIHYSGREPDGSICRCMLDFNYRQNQINDSSVFGNNALLKGLPKIVSYTPEYPPSSLQFDGTTSYVDMGTTSKLKVGEATDGEITVSYWVYFPSNPSSDAYVVSRGNTNSYAGFITSAGLIKAQFFYNDSTNAILNSGITGTGSWHRVVLSHSDVNNISKLWVDGVLTASNSKNDRLRDSGTGTDARFMLGAKSTGATTQSNYLGGNIKNVKVWSRQLTDAEALADYSGTYVSPVNLVSEWDFDEDEDNGKAFDSQGYNTGAINYGIYDKNQLPFSLTDPYPYKDGVVNELLGYRTTGDEYLIIPELSDDFRITDLDDGGLVYEWVLKLSTFDKFNGGYMRLLQKADDFDGHNIQSIQIRDDGRLYMMYKFDNTFVKCRTVYPLKLDKLYRLAVGIKFAYVNVSPVATFRVYLNGFQVGIEESTASSELPADEDINDFHTYLLTGQEPGIGNYVGQIYSFRYWIEEPDDANMLAMMTNKFTTRAIDRGHVLRSNLTKIYETTKNRENTFTLSASQITDLFDFFLTDTVPTARFTTPTVQVSDDFDFTLETPVHHYSLKLNGDTSYVEIPVIDPVRKHFSISVWVKYQGNSGGWGGVISRIDGMPNGNRLLLQPTKIRWHAKYGDADDPFVDYIATVPSITGSWHHIAMTYDGDDDERLKLFLDGHKYLDRHQEHQIKGGDDEEHSKTYIGKGADSNYYLEGNIDSLIIYDKTLTETEVRKLATKQEVRTGVMAKFIFEQNFKDTSDDADFSGTGRGGAKFSTDVP